MEFIANLPLLQIHLFAVFTTIGLVIVADLHGLAWILGKIETSPKQRMMRLHQLVWVGLITIGFSGLMMFLLFYHEYLVSVTAFWIKMGFVLALFINAAVIGRLAKTSYTNKFSELSSKERLPLLISGCISAVAWIGAFTTAKFLGL